MTIWTGRQQISVIQTCRIRTALSMALLYKKTARSVWNPVFKRKLQTVAFAFLNRACELACVPLAQYYAESPSGLDLVWVTYRPEAIVNSPTTDPAAMIYLGSVDKVTEDQARNRAIGW